MLVLLPFGLWDKSAGMSKKVTLFAERAKLRHLVFLSNDTAPAHG